MRTAGRGGRSRMIPAKLRRAVVVIKRRRGARDQMVPALASSAQLVAFGITSPKPLAHFLLIPELELIQLHRVPYDIEADGFCAIWDCISSSSSSRVMVAVGSAWLEGECAVARRARTSSAVASEVYFGRLWLRGASRRKDAHAISKSRLPRGPT